MVVESMNVFVIAVFGANLFCRTVLADQICSNCGIGSECGVYFDVTWPVSRDSECWTLCENAASCSVATFDGSSNCMLYECSRIGQRIGSKAYRKSSNSDCDKFEIYHYNGYEGQCNVITTEGGATSSEYCLERCLETSECRGTTYDGSTSTCTHDDGACSTAMTSSPSKTFVQMVCLDEQPSCSRDYMQTCVNCRAGYLCQTTFYQMLETKPLNIDTSVIGANPDVEQIWYFSNGSSYMHIQCPYVAQQIGDTVYRATCTQDCPEFELLTLSGHRGTCPVMTTLSGGVTLEYCVSKCLDIENCRGVTFDIASERCAFHNCTEYVVSTGRNFISRRCMDVPACTSASKIIQTCVGCATGPNCPDYYLGTDNRRLEKNCLDFKAEDTDSVIVHFQRSASSCNRTQCSQVRQEIGEMVYRDSCNTDCQKFEIFQLYDTGGTCDFIYSEEGGLTMHYCIEKCLDLTGCRATSFSSTTGRCDYHDCTNYTSTPGFSFMWKNCIESEPSRDFQQICDGCKMSDLCQKQASALVAPYATWETCEAQFQGSESRDVIMYRTYTNGCFLMNCTMVEQESIMGKMVFRNSPASDCPIFRLFTMSGYIGTCPIIGFHEGGVTMDYCIDKCLDMTGCRGVSHDTSQLKCFYHSCLDRDVNASFTFVKRVCMTAEELSPVKPYMQTIKNIVNHCNNFHIMKENNTNAAHLCNTTCHQCDVIVYDPIAQTCEQTQCDRPYDRGQGTTVFRKTANPVCLNFEMLAKARSAPNCEAFEYDEGVLNVEFCYRRCFDLPDCLSVYMDITTFNCTYHNCIDYVTKSTLDIFAFKNCFQDCPSPTTQTCFNCKQGSMCPSSFYDVIMSNSSSCKAFCESETYCKGVVYNTSSMECLLYECAYADQQYGSIFHRTSCNNDCPVYEMYLVEGFHGNCDHIPSMTEYLVKYPEQCYERCLDTAECRGVTYQPVKKECYYHICDCHEASTAIPNMIFMWKYCLDSESSATVLPSNGIGISTSVYPTTPECKPLPIYILPCYCSTGAFDNFTTEEIALQLEQNLTIDADSTSASIRKLTSAEDNRPTSIAVGSVGVILMSSLAAAIFAMDIPNFFKPVNQVTKSKKAKKPNTKESEIQTSDMSVEDTCP